MALQCRLLSAQTKFTKEPRDTTVEVGGTASFECTFAELPDCESVYWVQSRQSCAASSTLATCHTALPNERVDKSRLSVSFDEREYTMKLNITNVTMSDVGHYACWSYHGGPSSCGRLRVVNPPTPQCSSSPSDPKVGDTITLDCRVPMNATVPTKLTWHWETSSKVKITNTVHPGMSSQQTHVLRDTDNYKPFMCIAGNSLSTGPQCSVYPLQIHLTVRVVLLPTSPGNNGIALKFLCHTQSIPATTRHMWSLLYPANFTNGTEPEWLDVTTTQGRYQVLQSGRYLHISNITRRDDGLKVRCFASNSAMNATSKPVTIVNCANTNSFASNVTHCTVTTRTPQTDNKILNYAGIVTIYVIAFLAIVSVVFHIWHIRREKKTLITQLELTEQQNF
ncbi:cell adhesion molecule 2-like [Acanthaster planci]|uniref:Cell adhesion molecule 2-like n=1 Tax=Acanthaster planci TaxID=133434 RepID=A0A8B7XNQ0_ACAPL|nr:cell adhesion molecule 2-like [Acanthaster planci]